MLSTYSYDIHGNVDTLVQQYRKGMMAAHGDNRFKVMTYQYDLISGKVNQVHYQPGEADQYYHRYAYDAENRITDVYTTTNKALIGSDVLEDHEAFYSYYKHGPLARTILGQQQVQGVDYAYTLQGWLKGVNAMALDTAIDMGRDGGGTITARDAYGFQLNYFTGDYKPVNTVRNPFPGHSAYIGAAYRPLYNGNISSMGVNIGQLNQPQLYNYEYDQLNRLVSMQAYRNFDQPENSWSGISATTDHQEQITYDGNGNITAYLRNGNTSAGKPLAMDNLGYHYNKDGNGNLLNNRLRYVSDGVTANNNYTEDIDGQVDSSNYHYDQIGNLTHDTQEQIDSIEWNVYGKISRIWKNDNAATGALQQIAYRYDPSGNRISKTVYSNQDASNYKAVHTWYVRDASGNVMATYTSEDVAAKSTLATGTLGKLYLNELHMYGSSRLGIWSRKVDMDVVPTSGGTAPLLGTTGIDTFNRGNKFFELVNHLGNVLVTVSDRKVGQNPVNGVYSSYTAEVVSASDYAPFGMQMVGRTFSTGSYRYGFNGKEKDPETSGDGNQYDYGFRIYNPRLGRFLSVDPLTTKYPWYTPYQFAGNKPIWAVDLDGLEEVKFTDAQLDNELIHQTYQIKASITNTIIRLSPIRHDKILRDEFAKVGITDLSFVSSFQIRMRTIVTNTPPSEQDPIGSFMIENRFVIEEKGSAGREFLEAAFDLLSTASVIPTNNSTGVFAARGGSQFFINLGRQSIGLLYNVRRLSSIGVNSGLKGVQKLEDVMEAGMAFVGENAKKLYTKSGRFEGWESADGLKRFRPAAYKKNQGKYQSNFEQRTSIEVSWDDAKSKSNMHVDTDKSFDYKSQNQPSYQPSGS